MPRTLKKVLPFLIFCASLFLANPTYAVPDTDVDSRIVLKAMYQGLTRCYDNNRMTESFDTLSRLNGISDLTKSGGSQFVYLPTGASNVSDNDLNCRELFTGGNWNWKVLFVEHNGGTFSGILNYSDYFTNKFGEYQSTTASSFFNQFTPDEKKQFLEDLGYTVSKSSNSDSKSCFRIKYHVNATATIKNYSSINEDFYTNSVCIADDGSISIGVDGLSDSTKEGIRIESWDDDTFQISLDPNAFPGVSELEYRDGLYKELAITKQDDGNFCVHQIYEDTPCIETLTKIDKDSIDDLLKKRMIGISNSFQVSSGYVNNGYGNKATISSISTESTGEATASEYSAKLDKSLAGYVAVNSISDKTVSYANGKIALSEAEKLALYTSYLKDSFGATVDCSGDIAGYGGVSEIKYWDKQSQKVTTCYVDANNVTNKNAKVRAVDGNGWFESSENMDLATLLTALGGITIADDELTEEEKSELDNEQSNTEVEQEDLTVSTDACYNGAGSLGWILCPILKGLSGTMENLYSDHIEPALQFESILISSDNPQAGAYGAWQTFRTFANILFIILLLVVIFSQLTGVGIDNYGIKKILPKLVIMTIIVNISFLVCQLLVDTSNIIGSSLKNLLEGIADNTQASITTIEGTQVSGLAYAATGAFELVIALIAAFVGVSAIVGNLGLLLPLLLGLLSGVLSILFLFLLLAVRKAAIVILVAAAPIPLACYMLPNTKKVFDVWWKGLSALLLLYPICGLLIGGGGLASKIILSTGAGNISFFLGISAFVCAIAPIFFIPTLLRGSFKALGNIGAKISGVGKAVQRGTIGRFEKSDARKRMQTKLAASDAFGLRNRVANSKFGRSGIGRMTFSKAYARSIAANDKLIQEDSAADALTAREAAKIKERRDPNSVLPGAFESELVAALSSGDEAKFRSTLTEYQRRFGVSKAADAARRVIDSNQNSKLLAGNDRAEFLRRLGSDFSGTFAKTPDFARYLQTGGIGEREGKAEHVGFETVIDGKGSYIAEDLKIGDLKDEQIVGANSNTMARLIASGKLTQADTQRIMANKDNRAKMDSVQQLIMAAYTTDNVTLKKDEAEAILAGKMTVSSIDQARANQLIRQSPEEVRIV